MHSESGLPGIIMLSGCQVNFRDWLLHIGEEEVVPLRKVYACLLPGFSKVMLIKVFLLPVSESVVQVRVDSAQAQHRLGLLDQPDGSNCSNTSLTFSVSSSSDCAEPLFQQE